jgi:hypothetical protein
MERFVVGRTTAMTRIGDPGFGRRRATPRRAGACHREDRDLGGVAVLVRLRAAVMRDDALKLQLDVGDADDIGCSRATELQNLVGAVRAPASISR